MKRARSQWFLWGFVIIIYGISLLLGVVVNNSSRASWERLTAQMVRTVIYLCLFTAWGFAMRYRVAARVTRISITMLAGAMVTWVMLRGIKYTIAVDENFNRILWYFYYLPMLSIAFLSVIITISVNKPNQFKLPKWMALPAIGSFLLFLFVLTNDYHQMVFRFPEGAAVFTDDDYSYGHVYFIIYGWILLCMISSYGMLLVKCRRVNRKKIWIPLIPIGLFLLYSWAYATHGDVVHALQLDMTVFFCTLVVILYEACIYCGLIQTNSGYETMFRASQIPIYIADDQGQIYSQSNFSGNKTTARYRTSRAPIKNGIVVWEEDVTEMEEVLSELRDVNDALDHRRRILEEEYRTDQEKAKLTEINRLYYLLQEELSDCLEQMRERLQRLEETKDPVEEKSSLFYLMILGAYFKRRNGLLFLAEDQDMVNSSELVYCLRESMGVLYLAGVLTSYQVEVEGNMSIRQIAVLYTKFHQILLATRGELSAMAVVVSGARAAEVAEAEAAESSSEGQTCTMAVQLALKPEGVYLFPEDVEVEDEGDGEYFLTYQPPETEGGEFYAI